MSTAAATSTRDTGADDGRVRRLPQSWPLFLRIFALMLITVLLVQVLNFATLLLMPPPTPIIFSTTRIAAFARTGVDPARLLKTEVSTRRPAPTDSPRDRRLGAIIATDLGLPASAVVVEADRKSTRLNSSHNGQSRMPSSA